MALFGSKRIYLDYASATPLCPEAAREILRGEMLLGNPGSIHAEGVIASRELDGARERVAREFGCKPREIIFTSGGTEANNLAILGLAHKRVRAGQSLVGTHWVVSSIEHPSVLACFGEVERLGGSVSHVDPNERGIVSAEAVLRTLKKETVCVSIGWGNSEIGTIQPLSEIARSIRAHERAHKSVVIFHSDAGQAPLYLATTVHTLGVDMLSLDSAKLYGPRGVGALFVGGRVELSAVMYGGGQERGLRPGTENLSLALGFAEALARLRKTREAESKKVRVLRDALREALAKALPDMVVNGDSDHSLPHMLNISIPGIQSEYLILSLDNAGVAVSTKSACREGEESCSHVVEAMNGDSPASHWRATHTIRFSLGEGTTAAEIRHAAEACIELVRKSSSVVFAKGQ
jgi:cysteine desulfurase